ncbi:hypothetical protein Vafri_1134 [Volvox africanus]|nr:hypothetical protein Vafri_1134 [Volvox africanus]
MDSWSKMLRGGDNGFTPRRLPPPKQSLSATLQDKGRADKTPVPVAASGLRSQSSGTSRKPPPLVTDSPEIQQRLESPSQPASVYSGDGDADGTEDFENDSVQVFVRVRPPTPQELASDKHEGCLAVIGSRTLHLTFKDKQNTIHSFTFDQVLPEETPQHDLFELAGQVAVDNCLAGYNSSIFAYGQTGAGKTFTVIGQISCPEKRGLAPRVFEYLFTKITDHENARGPDTVKFNCRCAFLEIYNETIADLLCPSANNLPIREDPEKGPYVDGLSEPPALNVDEMLQHLLRGAENRHTGETRLNRESSRSHSVFMCTVEKTVTSNGISKCFYAKLNLVDLAGSERIASGAHGGSNAAGEHFKEACHINKSLTALGRVTTELVKSQKNGGGGHVPYRDSKLTFLLQSSLGGNAKTLIIANVSPSSICAHETLSTLRFAKQTKHIRNEAKVNWTVQGDRIAMQREIERLRMELAGMRSGITEPLVQANEELTARLEEERQRREELQQERERVVSALSQARRENRLLDQRLVGLAAISGMDGSRGAGALATVVEQLEALDTTTQDRRMELDEAQQELVAYQLQAEKDNGMRLKQELLITLSVRDDAIAKCTLLEAQLASLLKEKADLEESCSVLAENFAQAGAKITEQKDQLAEALGEVDELQGKLICERHERETVERHKVDIAVKLQAAAEEITQLSARESELQARLDDKQVELGHQGSQMEALERQLEGALSEVQLLQSRLAEAQEQLAQTQHDNAASCSELSDQIMQLTSKLGAAEAQVSQERDTIESLQRDLSSTRNELAVHVRCEDEVGELLKVKTEECSSALQRLAALESDLTARVEACGAAEAEVASLSTRLSQMQEQLASAEAHCSQQAELLSRTNQENADLLLQLSASTAAIDEAKQRAALAEQEVLERTARMHALEVDVADHATVNAGLQETLKKTEGVITHLEATVSDLRVQLSSAQGDNAASEERAVELRSMVAGMEARTVELEVQVHALEAVKDDLEMQITKQAAESQDRTAALALLEAQFSELEAVKASVTEKLRLEQVNVATLRDALSSSEECITQLRKQIQQEEARTFSALKEMSDTAAASQRQISKLEEQHSREVQNLKDELDKRSSALKSRDKEMVQKDFTLRNEIDRLNAQLRDQKIREEQIVVSNQIAIAEMNERLNRQTDRYAELTKKHDILKAIFDQSQRELESWKTKCERLDHALADVSRLVLFARNPPDSARSSQIMTRSDHRSLYIAESANVSPRLPNSRYHVSSPAGSKVGSVSHHNGCDDALDECGESGSPVPDVVSLGDQLPIQDDEDPVIIGDV